MKQTHHELQLAMSFWGLTAILAILVKINAGILHYVDLGVANHIERLVTPAHTRFFAAIAKTGSPLWTLVIALLLALGLWFAHQQILSFVTLTLMIGGDAVAWILKMLVQRVRPTLPLLPESGYSFPSGHVFGSAMLAIILIGIIFKFIRSARLQVLGTIVVIAWLALVLVSRIYLRAHFASDTVGSLLVAGGGWQQVKYFIGVLLVKSSD